MAVVPSVTSVAVTVMFAVASAGASVVSRWMTPSGLTMESVADVIVTGLTGVVPSVALGDLRQLGEDVLAGDDLAEDRVVVAEVAAASRW